MKNYPSILIAGASGYIGQALIPELLKKFPEAQVTALSRSSQESDDPRVTWKACDLFSLKALEQALPEKIDVAFYLVHSMGPTAELDQGSFADFDLLLADNFIRALKSSAPRQIVYLGGLIPTRQSLSLHLQSRLEVEETFRDSSIPFTVFRAGLIVGEQGSSFQILTKLVRRLPVMLCPVWTQTLTSPVDLGTVIAALADATLEESALRHVYDLASAEPLTYVEMMRQTARAMHHRRVFLTLPVFTPTLSRLWVSVITGAPKSLVYPLVSSLEHEMVARFDHLSAPIPKGQNYFSLVENLNFGASPEAKRTKFRFVRKSVRSVQRLPLPTNKDAAWIRAEYTRWLPRFLAPFINVENHGDRVTFFLRPIPRSMLDLELSRERSNDDRQLLYIRAGLLAAPENKGRLEFRVVLRRQFVIAAIHDFKPSLPWWLYQKTQALVHLWVMRGFARHLRRIGGQKENGRHSERSATEPFFS